MLLILLLVVCVVLGIILYKAKISKGYWKKRNILQEKDLMWTFTFEDRSLSEICKTIYDKHDKPYIGTTQGKILTLLLKNVEDVQAVLAGEFQSFYSRGININSNDVLAHNLLFLDDYQKWKLIRQKLSPVFTSSKLRNMFYILEKCAHDFAKFVEENENLKAKPFNMLYTYTTASIGASIFGIDTREGYNTLDSPFLDMAWKALEPSMKTNVVLLIWSFFPKIFKLLGLKVFGEHEKFFVGVVKSVLKSRRLDKIKDNHDFIDVCLEMQKNGVMQDSSSGYKVWPSDELLAAQAFSFFIAGADTSANVMHFTLLELASNQEILRKLHGEIDNVFKNNKIQLTYTDIESMQYLDMVISEAMRKYPPVGLIQRMCTKDTVLPSNIKIEKDTVIVVPVFAIHRDEKYYPNPNVFDPERFQPGNVSAMKKYTYLPFGEGNRICIGSRFARLQVKAGIARLLWRFTLAEQKYSPERFERSPFGIRDAKARYNLISRIA